MAERTESATGRCLCGAVRFAAAGKPLWVAHCHCESCRRNTGCALVTFVGFAESGFTLLEGTPQAYNSSPGVTRRFCGRCGTPLTYQADRFPGEVHVYVCTLDDPEAFVPRGHVHVGEKVSWLETADDLPRFQTTSEGG
jgi:hypothetical protein